MSKNKQHFALFPGRFKLDGGSMFGIIPRPLWQKLAPPDEDNRIDLALRLWAIKTEDRLVIVDTGIGDCHGSKFDQRFAVRQEQNPLEACLAEIGQSREDVTDLVLSHLHFDHAGGIAQLKDGKLVPTLPRATLHLHKKHYEYALSPTQKDQGSFHGHIFNPIVQEYVQQNKIHWLKGEEGEIIPELNLNFKCSHGHTPFLAHAYDENFIYLADLIPTSHHVHIPWIMAYDMSPGISAGEKEKFLRFARENKLTIIFEHDVSCWGSRPTINEKSEWVNTEIMSTSGKLVEELLKF